jgi:hypothetical protein
MDSPFMPKHKKNCIEHIPQIEPVGFFLSVITTWMLAGAALIAVAGVLAYLPALSGDFLMDVHYRTVRLLAGVEHHLLDRMAVVGKTPYRIPRHKPGLAHRRNYIDMAHFTEVVHSRGLSGSDDIRHASGERGIGGLDLAAQERDGHVVLPVVDFMVCEIR